MSESAESSVGASEHKKIIAQFGLYDNPALQRYVQSVGDKLVPHTERGDVRYQFFVIDSPIVNAFALPGGYIYISRGLMALANSEAEMASVLAHEIGHVTGRHSAERYSQNVLTSIGTSLLSAAIDAPMADKALGLGSDLFLKSYSRSQESEADQLGLRYLTRAGYDPAAMVDFFLQMQRDEELNQRRNPIKYFSTHPLTADRISAARQAASLVPAGTARTRNQSAYLQAISGMTWGDSREQGFVQNGVFYHPALGFRFDIPPHFKTVNTPTQVTLMHAPSGTGAVFDAARVSSTSDPRRYIAQIWARDKNPRQLESITINGMAAATAQLEARINNRPGTVQLVAIAFAPDLFYRFQFAIPDGTPQTLIDDLKKTTYSFDRYRSGGSISPPRLRIVTAKAGDTPESLAAPMKGFGGIALFRVLNALDDGAPLAAGQRYKIIQ